MTICILCAHKNNLDFTCIHTGSHSKLAWFRTGYKGVKRNLALFRVMWGFCHLEENGCLELPKWFLKSFFNFLWFTGFSLLFYTHSPPTVITSSASQHTCRVSCLPSAAVWLYCETLTGILRSAPDWFLLHGINLPTAPLMPRDQSWERILFISPAAGHPNPPVTQLIPCRSLQTASVILTCKMLNKERKGWACGNRSFADFFLWLLSRCLHPARIGFCEIWTGILLLDICMLLPDIWLRSMWGI